jgi:metal-responsive CopG/Arc/MetJ family transcriptional regulator
MSRTTKTLGFSMPAAMVEEFETLCEEERRTKSELFRAMFRVYKYYRKRTNPDQLELNIAEEGTQESA